MTAVPLPAFPYEFRRDWPSDWDLVRLLRAEAFLPEPGPARFLHPSLEVQNIEGKGRGIIATSAIEAGELIVLDSPIVSAKDYDALLKVVKSRSADDLEFRSQLLSMCGDSADVAARAKLDTTPSDALVKSIVRHNYHAVEPPPIDGEIKSEVSVVGLWPLGSLINHALRPNVTRSFLGHANCYRLIRPLEAGQEVLDNYLDLRLPFAQRQKMMRTNHGMKDEGPDPCDASSKVVADIQAHHEEALRMSSRGSQEAAQNSFTKLAELTNRCHDVKETDPAFADVFRDFAVFAGKLGNIELSLQGYAAAIEFATAREPFSVVSVIIAARMLHMALLAADKVDEETRTDLEVFARKHFRMVYGPLPGAFELCNPDLTKRLTEAASADKDGAPDQKKPRVDE